MRRSTGMARISHATPTRFGLRSLKQEDFFETKLELNEDNKKLLKVVEVA